MCVKLSSIRSCAQILFLLLLLFCADTLRGQEGYERSKIDSLIAAANGKPDSVYIRNAFAIADLYMSMDHYDSAQLWLNTIHERVSYRQPSLFSYFLTTRQAEVYYYNNLQQLGMQEANRALRIAELLKDNILLADAYNFEGLFYTNMGKLDEAVKSFKKGIAICKQPPYPGNYIELSAPHHLYGNLSEAFEKDHQYDSAIYFGKLSMAKAGEIKALRGVASAAMGLGTSFLNKRNADSAAFYFEKARDVSIESKDFDLELNTYSGLALSAAHYDAKIAVLDLLEQGTVLLNKHQQLNSFYALLFLEQAAKLYKEYGMYEELAKALERKSAIETATNLKNNEQYRTILMTGVKNETRILNLEVEEAKQDKLLATTRLYLVVLGVLLLATGFIAYRYYARQKLKLADLRNKISQDLHDEVGATLSGIALYSYIAKQQNLQQNGEQVIQSLDIIDKNATDMVKKLSDIVWAVNPVHDSLDAMMHRLEEYAVEHAAAKSIQMHIGRQEYMKQVKLSMEQRKNIYLIAKEAINNAVKYSASTNITVDVAVQNKELVMDIRDDGGGFDVASVHKGNGLVNMQQRAKEIHAVLDIESIEKGTSIRFRCKITQ